MDVADLVLLAAAGVGAGVVGSTAGLASLVSYPALLLVGLPPVTANVTNTISLIGSSVGSVAGSTVELTGLWRAVLRRLPIAILGGAAGAVVLLVGSPGSFEAIVPALIAFASVMLLLSPRIRALGRRRGAVLPGTEGGAGVTAVLLLTFGYAGYFGAAAGVMVLAVLLSRTDHSLPVANAYKNAMLGAANGTAAVVFAFASPVAWTAVPPLLVGCLVGGWFGPAVVRRVPEPVLRWTIGLAGLALAARLALVAGNL